MKRIARVLASMCVSGFLVLAAPPAAYGAASSPRAVAYQINRVHSGHLSDPTFTVPLAKEWSVDLGALVSYPLVAGGRVFVTVGDWQHDGNLAIYALDASSGATLWERPIGSLYNWANAAFGGGKVFVLNYDGLLQALNAATGASLWSVRLPGQYAFSSPPTVRYGTVYTGGAGSGGTVYAVNAKTGAIRWTASVMNGDDSSPALSKHRVFVSYSCPQVYAFEQDTGALAWHYSGPCEGGGGRTPVWHRSRLYVRDEVGPGLVFAAGSGHLVDGFAADPAPAFSGDTGVFLSGGTLRGIDLSTGTVIWSFAGGGQLDSAPIIVNRRVYVGGSDGVLFGVRLSDGHQVWRVNVGSPILAPDEHNVSQPLTGLGAGGGLLIPASDWLVAFGPA
jgi:outer membrane protein assembly factor BamB